ncbi:MAG TPA: VCBS repeat-containing protein, partial [Chryseosolibacter sp.]|nr:VCBS repeat-containing protein [Chryseosolibacter sp.]
MEDKKRNETSRGHTQSECRLFISFFAAIVLFAVSACENQVEEKADTLFVLLPSDSSGVDFINQITPSDQVNILTYEYMYNGGGIGVGDFNNDGYQDLVLAGSQVPAKLYINKGKSAKRGFSFEDKTATSGIGPHENWAFGVSVVDINQDGLQDIYFSMGGPGNKNRFPNLLFVNMGVDDSGNPRFEEKALDYGLADTGHSIHALFFDYDRDGDLDMYQLTGGGFERSPNNPFPIVKDGTARNTDRLYRNDFNEQAGHPMFTDVSKEAGVLHEGYGLGISFADFNEDRWPDLYITNDYLTNDQLYINNRDGTFTESVSDYFQHTSHFAMGNDIGDINNDGLMDVVVVDMLPDDHYRRKLMFGATQYNKFNYAVNHGYTHQYMRNTLQLNNGNGSYSEIGQLSGIYKTDWSWAVLFADLNNDQFQDIFITNGFGKDVTDLDFVKFRSNMTSEIKNESRRRQILLDSLASRPGIEVSNYAYQNMGNLFFKNVSANWGFQSPAYSNGAAYADFDHDGDLDLVVSNLDQTASVYRNTLREKHPSTSNYLRVKLKGIPLNQSAWGSKVEIRHDGMIQSKYKTTVHGFQSSMEDILHFGLDSTMVVDTLIVHWPDGKTSMQTNVKANQVLQVDYNSGSFFESEEDKSRPTVFQEIDNRITHQHIENDFIDFNHEPLLPHKLSREGPGMAVGDVNGDGREDLFVGGALLQAGKIFLQRSGGSFEGRDLGAQELETEDMGALFFDADNDDDLDLYVVSGGNEYEAHHRHYQDRIYFNDGKGIFTKKSDALPDTDASGSCVVAADYDHDGDLDLFVGGRVLPGSYPKAPRSYLLNNNGKGKFLDVTAGVAPGLEQPGMITSALWTDFDNDGWKDLVVVGEYMPISFFRNVEGQKIVQHDDSGLTGSEGWWKSVTAGDFDNDGDMDYLAGNFGLNSHYSANAKEPINVTFKDFDNNGALEAITSYYEDGINYPTASMDVLTNQLPLLKRKILFHRTYANTSTDRLLEIAGAQGVGVLECRTLESAYVENIGGGKFQIRSLPLQMQFAPVYGMLAEDVNFDGNLDFIAVGNSYAPDVVSGRCDAFIGQVMVGDGHGSFKPMPITHSGFFVQGDAKSLVQVSTGSDLLTLVAQNDDAVKTFQPTHG